MTNPESLRRFTPPCASDALRERVLARARAAVRADEPISRTDRIWFSPRWRLAWVAAIAACALVEALAMRAGLAHRGPTGPTPALVREADAAALEIGFSGRVVIGDRALSNERNGTRGVMEDSL